jgi:predicted O-methyltransferase YrrM
MTISEKLLGFARSAAAKPNLYVIERSLRAIDASEVSKIPTSVSEAELRVLYYLARTCRQDATILEIGSYLGASTCYLAAGAAKINGRIVCVDTWMNETMPEGRRDTYAEFLKNTAGASQLIVPVRKRSDELTQADIPNPLDLVFIDGDHTYQGVKGDFERILPWLGPSAVVAFHDALWFEGVSCVIGEALITGTWAVGGAVHNLCWLKRPPATRRKKDEHAVALVA